MAESVDAADLKSAGRKTVGVQVPLPPSLQGVISMESWAADRNRAGIAVATAVDP